MAVKKSKSSEPSSNGVETDVLEKPVEKIHTPSSPDVNPAKGFKDSAWFGNTEEKDAPPSDSHKDSDDQDTEEDALDPLEKSAKQIEQEEQLKKAKEEEEETSAEPTSVLDAMTKGEDNEFSLDDAEKKKEEKDGEAKPGEEKTKDKQSDTDVLTRIAKDLDISDAQTPEQLVSSIKEKLSSAKAGAGAPVAALDKVLSLNNRDFYKTYLMKQHRLSEERAEKYITERVELHGEEWITLEAEPLRMQLETLREKVVTDHVQREAAKEQETVKFANDFKDSVKDIKTMFGIPLKKHVPKIKEFQAQTSNQGDIDALRNDPKLLSKALFYAKYGESIFKEFLEEKLSENGKETWNKYYKSEIDNKILNHSKPREQTEYSNKGVKPSEYKAGGWD